VGDLAPYFALIGYAGGQKPTPVALRRIVANRAAGTRFEKRRHPAAPSDTARFGS